MLHIPPPWRAWRGLTISRAPWVAALLILAGVIALLLHISATTMDYSRYNPEWNGTSRLFQAMDDRGAIMVDRLDGLPGSGDCLLFILAPEGDFDAEEIARLRLFLEGGNTVVFVSDREDENTLLIGLGSTIAIHNENLSSVDRYADHPASVLAFPSQKGTLGTGISRLLLNNPSFVEGGDSVFETSILSWIDKDGNSRLTGDEPLQKYSVVAEERHGNGTLYVIADPSIFINVMQNPGEGNENAAFSDSIISRKSCLLVDQSHSRTASGPLVIRAINVVKESTIHKMAVVTLIFLAISLLIVTRRKNHD